MLLELLGITHLVLSSWSMDHLVQRISSTPKATCGAMHAQLDLRTDHEWKLDPPTPLKEDAAVLKCERQQGQDAQACAACCMAPRSLV